MKSLKHTATLWEYLQKTTAPIVLYGAGDGADKILDLCERYTVKIMGIFSSSHKKNHKTFRGYEISLFSDLASRFGDEMIILVAFGTSKPDVMAHIDELSKKYKLFIPDTAVVGGGHVDRIFIEKNYEKITEVSQFFKDKKSYNLYKDLFLYKLTGEIDCLKLNTDNRSQMLAEIFSFKNDEVFVDAGAYRGDTVEEFINAVDGNYKKIFALEPDGKNYQKLKEFCKTYANIEIIEAAAWDKQQLLYFMPKSGRSGHLEDGVPNTRAITIDSVLGGDRVGYIKYDVEGAENQALSGSARSIKQYKPKLLVSVYHRPEDLFEIPLYLKTLVPEYKFFLRRSPGYPAWDINLMCTVD